VDGDLGWMLYDMDFSNPADPRPSFFRARLGRGVLDLSGVDEAALPAGVSLLRRAG